MLIKYKKKNVLTVGEFKLIPGNNDIPTDRWTGMVKLYPRLKHLISDGTIEVFGGDGRAMDEEKAATGTTEGVLEANDLAKLSEKKAVALVKETVDVNVLTQWHTTEKRKAVIKAIEGQFEAIAKSGEPTDEETQAAANAAEPEA